MTIIVVSASWPFCKGIKLIHQVLGEMPDIHQVLDISRYSVKKPIEEVSI